MTDQPKWTPGPWDSDYLDQNGQRVVSGQHIEICTCWHHSVGSIEKEMEANAHLIAAAPDLYAALELIRNNEVVRAVCPSPLWGKMADAMIKARGETK